MLTKTDNQAHVGMHVFERAGLGKAPFRCVGAHEEYITHPDGTTQASGSCQFCGMGIRNVFMIRGADGKMFKVGSDCVARTGDEGLIKSYKTHPAVRQLNRDKAQARDDRVVAEWNTLISDSTTITKLSAIMVPGRPWIAGEQVTLLESMDRLWNMCGAVGRNRTLKTLKRHLNP